MGDADAGSSVELRGALTTLAGRIVDEARWADDRVSWPTPRPEPDPGAPDGCRWRLDPQAPAWLYDGLAGIARGLALASPVVRDTHPALAGAMRTTARAALRGALDAAALEGKASAPLGLYDGVMGVACVGVELGRLWRAAPIEAEALRLAAAAVAAAAAAPGPEAFDLVSGRAGVVCGAGWIGGWTGGRLGTAWHVLVDATLRDPPSAVGPGLAHGLAGVAVALGHAWRLGVDPSLLGQVVAVEAREDAAFSAEAGGWPDAREDGHFPCWWCHGAVGIGLARQRVGILTGRRSDAPAVARRALLHALDTAALSHDDWSLCHGLGGAVALLLAGALPTRADADRRRAGQLLREGAAHARHDRGWPGGAPLEAAQTGLMTGHAGILLLLAHTLRAPAPWPLWL